MDQNYAYITSFCLFYSSKLNETQNSYKLQESNVQPAQILFHKKKPPKDFIRKTLSETLS